MKKVFFPLQTLKLCNVLRWGQGQNGLYLERIDSNSISGDNEAQQSARLDTEYAFMRIQTHAIKSTPQEDSPKMGYVLLATIRVCGEVIQIWIGDVFDVMENL